MEVVGRTEGHSRHDGRNLFLTHNHEKFSSNFARLKKKCQDIFTFGSVLSRFSTRNTLTNKKTLHLMIVMYVFRAKDPILFSPDLDPTVVALKNRPGIYPPNKIEMN